MILKKAPFIFVKGQFIFSLEVLKQTNGCNHCRILTCAALSSLFLTPPPQCVGLDHVPPQTFLYLSFFPFFPFLLFFSFSFLLLLLLYFYNNNNKKELLFSIFILPCQPILIIMNRSYGNRSNDVLLSVNTTTLFGQGPLQTDPNLYALHHQQQQFNLQQQQTKKKVRGLDVMKRSYKMAAASRFAYVEAVVGMFFFLLFFNLIF